MQTWIGTQPPAAMPSTAPAFISVFTLTASTHKVAWVIRAPKTGTLNRFGVRLGTVANTPDNGIRFSFQDVTISTGAPDEVQDQFADVTTGLVTDAWCEPTTFLGASGTGSGAKRSVTAGDPWPAWSSSCRSWRAIRSRSGRWPRRRSPRSSTPTRP